MIILNEASPPRIRRGPTATKSVERRDECVHHHPTRNMTAQAWIFVVIVSASASGQVLMDGSPTEGPIRLLPSDAAVLDTRQIRTDLPCELTPTNPELGFDLSFHAGYEIALPLRALAGTRDGNTLTAVFRVVPAEREKTSTYFRQKWTVPPLPADTKGTALLRGSIVVGEGDYHVDWLIRDRSEQFCTAFWRFSASRRGKDRPVALRIEPGVVLPAEPHPFMAEPPPQRDTANPLSVLVLLHVAPTAEGASAMPSEETIALLSILRSIAREPRIASYSMNAFNIEQNEEIYRQEDAAQIDFPALGAAIEQLHLGTVDLQRLRNQGHEDLPFITGILQDALGRKQPDALIFIGPKGRGGNADVHDSLKQFGTPVFPVFYLNYSAGPPTRVWGDAIGSIVKLWNGTEYTVERPRDVFFAWGEVMSRIAKKSSNHSVQLTGIEDPRPKNVNQQPYKEHR